MKREDVEGTIKSMARKYSKPHFIFKNRVRVGGLGHHFTVRFYKDAFIMKGRGEDGVKHTERIFYEDVQKLAMFFSRLFIICENFDYYLDF